jgi:hypothetical protein
MKYGDSIFSTFSNQQPVNQQQAMIKITNSDGSTFDCEKTVFDGISRKSLGDIMEQPVIKKRRQLHNTSYVLEDHVTIPFTTSKTVLETVMSPYANTDMPIYGIGAFCDKRKKPAALRKVILRMDSSIPDMNRLRSCAMRGVPYVPSRPFKGSVITL